MQISPLAVSFLIAFASAAPMPVPHPGWGSLVEGVAKSGVKAGATEGVQSASSSVERAGASLGRASSDVSPFEMAAVKPFGDVGSLQKAGSLEHASSGASELGPLTSTDHLLAGQPGAAVTGTKSQALARLAAAKAKLDAAKGTTTLEHVDSLKLNRARLAKAAQDASAAKGAH